MTDTKTCRSCANTKPVAAFLPQRAKCRECMNAERRARYAMDPTMQEKNSARNAKRWPNAESQREYNRKRREAGLSRASHLWGRYRITPEQFDELWVKQGEKCPICLRNDDSLVLCVDHDHACCPTIHTCGSCIRGILCRECNYALGFFQDDQDRIDRAANYLHDGAQ